MSDEQLATADAAAVEEALALATELAALTQHLRAGPISRMLPY